METGKDLTQRHGDTEEKEEADCTPIGGCKGFFSLALCTLLFPYQSGRAPFEATAVGTTVV
jgi:hypothetical protein